MTEGGLISPGSQVTLHLSLALTDGTLAISTFESAPMRFTVGDGTLQPGLELALYGMRAGQKDTVTLEPEQAYGLHDPALVRALPLAEFPDEIRPEPGQIIGFALPDGAETPGTVLAVDDEQVRVDFNHPLAGRDVVFRIQVLAVDDPDNARRGDPLE